MAYSEERRAKVEGKPESGARTMAGKSNEPDANLKFGNKASEEVKTVNMQANLKACIRAAAVQNGGNVIPLTLEKEDSIADARAKNGCCPEVDVDHGLEKDED